MHVGGSLLCAGQHTRVRDRATPSEDAEREHVFDGTAMGHPVQKHLDERINDTFERPEMATDLTEHNIAKLNMLY
jgi:hypothetical protein